MTISQSEIIRSFPFEDPGAAGAPRPGGSFLRVRLPNGTPAVLVCGQDGIRQLLTDDRFSRAQAASHGMTARSPESLALNSADPPDHTRRRRTVAAAFTTRRAEAERPWIRATARDLVSALAARGARAELIEDFSLPLSVAVICRIMGVPAADLPRFRPLVDVMMSTSGHPAQAVRTAHAQMFDYFAGLYDAGAADDQSVLGQLAAAAGPDGAVTRNEAIHIACGLLMAGYETTSNQIAICVALLLAERSGWDRLRADPDARPRAIEEMLRCTSLLATGGVPHVALADAELDGCPVPAGQVVLPVFAAANRDPGTFAEPDRLRLDRDGPAHVAFGHGRHLCLGAPLARVELAEALGALLDGLPGLDLAVPGLRWRQGTFIRGLAELPVRW